MNKKKKAVLGLLLLLVVVAGLTVLGVMGAKDIKLGLDLNGGVSITYQTVEENPTDEQMADTRYKLQLKAQDYSTEAEVYQEGGNRINIDIPGATDATEILEELGEPGTLQFMDGSGNVLLTGDDVKNAKAGMTDQNGTTEYVIELNFNEAGAEKFAQATKDNLNKPIYIVYNNEVISAPTVQAEITGGQASITGISDYEEADRIASTIRIGALPLQLTELRSQVVGAKLGQEAISTSLKAGAIGFGLVVVFMCAVYLLPGFAASLALVLYVGLELLLLQAFEITLTLPGIAGIILSVGMAVDANVIIFTRIKEEIGAGNSVNKAIKAGYSKALSAIIDGNVTTLIAAVVLYLKGSGTVKGFASTLALGIVVSLITALFITRGLMWCFYELGAQSPKFYGVRKQIKVRNFIGFRKWAYTLSAIVIVAGLAFMGVNKGNTGNILNYGLDFMGGSSTNVTFNENLDLNRIDQEVVPLFESVTNDVSTQTQKVEGTNEVIIKTRTLTVEERDQIYQKLADEFGVDESKITTENISGAISDEMKSDAVVALLIAIVCMLIYIWFRFKDLKFATASVLALCHDVLVTLAFYAVLRWAVNSTFIACILTIVGYSINATIVIFDRIREGLALAGSGKKDYAQIVNTAISQTLTRSINTSLTTFVMVLVLYILGVSSVREFALPLMVGIVCGAYSSVCIAGPLWYDLTMLAQKRKAKK